MTSPQERNEAFQQLVGNRRRVYKRWRRMVWFTRISMLSSCGCVVVGFTNQSVFMGTFGGLTFGIIIMYRAKLEDC